MMGRARLVAGFLTTVLALGLTLGAAAHAATGDLTPVGCVADNDTGTDSCSTSTDGLRSPRDVAFSPDSSSVVVASNLDSAVANLARSQAAPGLVPKGCIDDNDAAYDACPISIDGLANVSSVAISADGSSVYTASRPDRAIAKLSRNTSNGALTPLGCIGQLAGPESCGTPYDGMFSVHAVTTAPDGKDVYVAGDPFLVDFTRAATTGVLTDNYCFGDDDDLNAACSPGDHGFAAGLDGGWSPVVSPDGRFVYVVSMDDAAIVGFARDTSGVPTTLTSTGCIDDMTGADTCSYSVAGMAQPTTAAISPDGRSLYVVGASASTILIFDRDPSSGVLTAAGCVSDIHFGLASCAVRVDGMNQPWDAAVSPDGRSLYVAAAASGSVSTFVRSADGSLAPAGCVEDSDGPFDSCAKSADGLGGAIALAVSPDGRSVVVAGSGDDAIVALNREIPQQGGSGNDTDPPETTIDKKPKKRTEKRKAKVKFTADEAQVTFECKLDRKQFKACESPFKKKVKADAKHKFLVRARDAAGNVDPTPAKAKWKVLEDSGR